MKQSFGVFFIGKIYFLYCWYIIFIIQKYVNLDDITNENNEDHNKKWPYIRDHPYIKLIIGCSGSGKINALLNLIREQDNDELIEYIFLHSEDFSERKYQFLLQKSEEVGIKHLNGPNAFIEYSNTMNDVYNYTNDYNLNRNWKLLVVFDDMIDDKTANLN